MFTKSERNEKITLLENAFSNANGIYLTDIDRIGVDKITKLRAEFRKNGVTYIVIKNNLAKIALERCGKKGIVPFVTGPTGVALANDEPTTPAKLIKAFRKENKNLLKVKAAYVEGAVLDESQAERLADVPSREILLSQLLSCLKAPVTNMAGVLNGILSTFVFTLEAVKKKKESEQ